MTGGDCRVDLERLERAYAQVRAELLAERTPGGWWVGELSSSALSTATAVSALAIAKAATTGRSSEDPIAKAAASGCGTEGSGFRVQGSGSEPRSLPNQQRPLATHHAPRTAGLEVPGSEQIDSLISRGVAYLLTQQNDDGGFGDTDLSHSNIATTMLVVAALHLAGAADEQRHLLARANAYIDSQGRLAGLRRRYGIDKTFVVPIMTNLALAGLVEWREVDPLPFELACVPQAWYRFVGMPVVSYAIPALVAIGQARFFHAPPRNPVTRLIRRLSIQRSLQVLRRMQPESGGYLEATPLTSFVVMSLASQGSGFSAGRSGFGAQGSAEVQRPKSKVQSQLAEEVVCEGVKFLVHSIRPDGSWPIDTNLATWNTTLAINALAGAGENVAELLGAEESGLGAVPDAAESASIQPPHAPQRACPTGNVLDWLLSCQHTQRHPFTGADPGGFGWTDLSGAVPDADDTPGAILALSALHSFRTEPAQRVAASGHRRKAIQAGRDAVRWLGRLRNRDGGWPTFCRGWGKLPFDRSGVDLTAHALRAIATFATNDPSPHGVRTSVKSAWFRHGLDFIRRKQHPDGSWSPLWFGNQDHPDEDNPVYGTAKVLMAYRDLGRIDSPEAQRGIAWLVANQNADGGWGSGVWRPRARDLGTGASRASAHSIPSPSPVQSSIEETALAVEALLAAWPSNPVETRNATVGVPCGISPPEPQTRNPEPRTLNPCLRGLAWLLDRVERGEHRQPAPIGFYFAKLWYYERLYPLTFTVAALGRARRQFARLERPVHLASDAP